MKKWTLITEWFWPNNADRQYELQQTLQDNLSCENIENIHLFVETEEGLPKIKSDKVTLVFRSERPTYNYLVQYAKVRAENEHVVIANNDISFAAFVNFVPQKNTIYACSRHEMINKELVWLDEFHKTPNRHESSQDAWFFIAGTKLRGGRFTMGVPGCDTLINWLFEQSGNRIINIGNKVRLMHRHKIQSRSYSQPMLPTPRLYVNVSGHNNIIFNWKVAFFNPEIPSHKRPLWD